MLKICLVVTILGIVFICRDAIIFDADLVTIVR